MTVATPPFEKILGIPSVLCLGTRVSNLKSVALTVLELLAFNSHDRPLRTHKQTHIERTHYLRHSLRSLGGDNNNNNNNNNKTNNNNQGQSKLTKAASAFLVTGATQVSLPNGISFRPLALARCTSVIDRLWQTARWTDHATVTCRNRRHYRYHQCCVIIINRTMFTVLSSWHNQCEIIGWM